MKKSFEVKEYACYYNACTNSKKEIKVDFFSKIMKYSLIWTELKFSVWLVGVYV